MWKNVFFSKYWMLETLPLSQEKKNSRKYETYLWAKSQVENEVKQLSFEKNSICRLTLVGFLLSHSVPQIGVQSNGKQRTSRKKTSKNFMRLQETSWLKSFVYYPSNFENHFLISTSVIRQKTFANNITIWIGVNRDNKAAVKPDSLSCILYRI